LNASEPLAFYRFETGAEARFCSSRSTNFYPDF
jgi:hypothetical protein